MCSYMNDCSGNGDCNSYGKCECKSGFFGADCSTQITEMSSLAEGHSSESVKASKWHYYSMPANTETDYQVTVSADRPVEIYLKKGVTQDLPD